MERQLIEKLLHGYTKLERPVANSSLPVSVLLHITLQQIIDLDEKNQILTINAWLNYVCMASALVSNDCCAHRHGMTTV